ncbi:MAG: hypothetical protein ACRDTC_07170 [Pseudonocardiaceae bacterium]
MKFDSRLTVVAAALALPLGAALASYALADDLDPPHVPAQVQIGESSSRMSETPPPTSVASGPSNAPTGAPSAQAVPPPPVSDDDDNEDGRDDEDDDDGGGGDDGADDEDD